MEEILKTIIESLVDNKEQVQITRTDDEKGVLLKVKVADEEKLLESRAKMQKQ
mgnify:CR=1 FL=1